MSDGSEKPFEATPQRLEKARRDGDVARSGELAANFAFACAALGAIAAAPSIGAYARAAIVQAASGAAPWSAAALLGPALVPLAGGAVAALAAGALQSGFHFAPVRLRFERLSPIEGIKRMISREAFTHGLRAAAAFLLATTALVPIAIAAVGEILRASGTPGMAVAAWHACERASFTACAVGAVFAAAEYAAARGVWLRRLRMSFEERKRESKEQDGDPLARGRRRSLHRSLVRGTLADVKDAAFVVANPTHVAVALEYRPPQIDVPRVAVRAAGAVALRVRELARSFGIPVVDDVLLARALYRDGRVGEPIARAHYAAVAAIVIALARSNV